MFAWGTLAMHLAREAIVARDAKSTPDRPICATFSTDGMPLKDRLDAWNARFGSVNSITVAPPCRAAIAARNENWMLGPMLFSASESSTAVFERGHGHVRRDGLDHWVIRVLTRGRNNLQLGDQRHALLPGSVCLFSLDQIWDSHWADAAWLSVCIPRHAFPDLSAGLATLPRGPIRAPAAAFVGSHFEALHRFLASATEDQVPALAEATRAVLGSCLLTGAERGAPAPADVAVAQLERVRGLIRQHLASPRLDATRLARLVGMSRSALYRLFTPHGGVARYIQLQRLLTAHTLLANPATAGMPIAALAEKVGFYDPSTFSRAFRAEFGYTPREARLGALTSRPLASAALPANIGAAADFGGLLRAIALATPGRPGASRAPVRLP
jgi:AraC-like DNA-binding protein